MMMSVDECPGLGRGGEEGEERKERRGGREGEVQETSHDWQERKYPSPRPTDT